MIRQIEIAKAIDLQRERFLLQDNGLAREAMYNVPIVESFATIITGIRRCGKSTLLLQILKAHYNDAIYLNFDDIRLIEFEASDFVRLDNEIRERGIDVIFFDEIQAIKGWEIYVNQLLREGYKVFVTGSNASMLSVELGTQLTGRHLSMELFPFSYSEFLSYKQLDRNETSAVEYMLSGGIPEYLKSRHSGILNSLVDDILMRDIVVRHSVRDANSLRQLVAYLISNIGNLMSANKLVGMFNIKSASTILEFFSYLNDSYLFQFIPLYSHSLKSQARNPKKVYVTDMGIYTENTLSTSENIGRRMENLVFIELRRQYKQIYYYKNKGECDFVVMENGSLTKAVQVCYNMNDGNFDREYNGLLEAMSDLNIDEGFIITLNQKDEFHTEGKTIKVLPLVDFL